jgi:hypothetical protein
MLKQKLASVALMGVVAFNLPGGRDFQNWQNKFKDGLQSGIEHVLPAQTENDDEDGDQERERNRDREELKNSSKEANRFLSFVNRRAVLGSAKVTAVNGTTLTVTQGDKTYSVLTSADTKFKRKFWGESSLSEIAVGNVLNVVGKWNDEAKTEINALWIRNLSIQKRFGVFFGEVKSVSTDGFVMTTQKREDQTVTIGTAKLVNRKGETIVLSDIAVGHKVRVKGMWDSVSHTITETAQVKDFNLPVVTVTATPTPTPTVTP